MKQARKEYVVVLVLITIFKIGVMVTICAVHIEHHEVEHDMGHRVYGKKAPYTIDQPM